MNIWKSLIMLLMVLGFGYYAFRDLNQEEESQKPKILPAISYDDIRGIRVEFTGGSYEIAKVETTLSPEEQIALGTDQPYDRWVLFFPPGAPTDPKLSDTMVRSLVDLREENSFAEDESNDSPVDMGLVPPELQIVITLKNEKEQKTLLFGKEHAVTKRRYMQIQDSTKVHLVPTEIFDLFRTKALALRLATPLHIMPSKIREIAITERNGSSHYFLRTGSGAWSLGFGKELVMLENSAEVDKLVTNFVSPSVASYLDGELPDMAVNELKNPRYRVEVKVDLAENKQRKYQFALSDFPDGMFNLTKDDTVSMSIFRWKSSPWAYAVRKASFGIITKSYEEFLAKYILDKDACDPLQISDVFVAGVRVDKLANMPTLVKEVCALQVLSFSTNESQRETKPSRGFDGGSNAAFQINGSSSKGKFILTITDPIKLYGSKDAQSEDAPYSGAIVWESGSSKSFEISSVFVSKLAKLLKVRVE